MPSIHTSVSKEQQTKIIHRLFELGHFFNPMGPPPPPNLEENLDNLSIHDAYVVRAIASWQDMMATDMDRLSLKLHGRRAYQDGIIGPATLASFEIPRCGHPDYTREDMLGITGIGKVGTGSWPEPCQKKGVSFSVAPAGQPAITRDNWPEILANVVATYNKVGVKLIPHTGSGNANIRVSWRGLAGSTIGLAEFNSRSCSDSVFCYLDTGFNANKFAIMDLLCHEMGHNMNLNHTRGGIMNASLGSVSSFKGWTPDDPSWSTLVRYFGGEPVEPDVPPNPPVGDLVFDPVSGNFSINNQVVGKATLSGQVSSVSGDVVYQGQPRGRLVMTLPF